MTRPLRVATRGSELARWQAERVADAARRRRRARDRLDHAATSAPTSPIHAIGGTGVFVKEVQEAVLDGRADVAVHSAKDLPADHARRASCSRRCPSGPTRATRSSGSTLDALPAGRAGRHRVGAPARAARGAATRPHLRRAARQHRRPGSRRRADFDAVVVAAAALDRLGLARPRRPSASTRR